MALISYKKANEQDQKHRPDFTKFTSCCSLSLLKLVSQNQLAMSEVISSVSPPEPKDHSCQNAETPLAFQKILFQPRSRNTVWLICINVSYCYPFPRPLTVPYALSHETLKSSPTVGATKPPPEVGHVNCLLDSSDDTPIPSLGFKAMHVFFCCLTLRHHPEKDKRHTWVITNPGKRMRKHVEPD